MEMLPSALLSVPGLLTLLVLVAAGYALGVVGNVGGPLFVLILLVFARLPIATAIGTAMLASCLISLFAAVGHWRRKNIIVGYAMLTGVAGAIGCFIGAYFARRVPEQFLAPLLGLVVLIIPTIGLLRLLARRAGAPSAQATGAPFPPVRLAFQHMAGGTMGSIVGFFCGAFGLGGATPLAALSRMLLRQPMRLSIGSAYLAAFCISLVGTAFYAANGQIAVGYAVLLSVGCGSGVYLSTRAVSRIPDRVLEVLLLTTMVAMALFTLFGSWRRL